MPIIAHSRPESQACDSVIPGCRDTGPDEAVAPIDVIGATVCVRYADQASLIAWTSTWPFAA